MYLRLLLATFLVFLLAGEAWGADVEERCQELIDDGLGSTTCMCSERLDWNAGTLSEGCNDPSDSSSPYECNPLEGPGDGGCAVNVLIGGNSETQLASVRGGLPGPTRVVHRISGSGQIRSQRMVDFTNDTYCMRGYRREDDDAVNPVTFGDDNYKGMLFDKDKDGANTSPQVELHLMTKSPATDSGTFLCSWIDKNNGYLATSGNMPRISGPGITLNDCSDQGWCRWEVCVDHNLASESPANSAHVRCRLTRLSDGEADIWEGTSTNGQSAINTGDRTFPMRFKVTYVSQSTAGWEMHYSHAMIATKSPADETFWIGAASEIEGGAPPPPFVVTLIATPGATEIPPDVTPTLTWDWVGETGSVTCDVDCDGDLVYEVTDETSPYTGCSSLSIGGVFTFNVECTDQFPQTDADASFITITPGPSFPGTLPTGVTLSVVEPTEDEFNQPMEGLQFCAMEVTPAGTAQVPIQEGWLASSPMGGGTHPFDLTDHYPQPEGAYALSATCTNLVGEGPAATTALSFRIPACGDSILDPGEECDPPNPGHCTPQCTNVGRPKAPTLTEVP